MGVKSCIPDWLRDGKGWGWAATNRIRTQMMERSNTQQVRPQLRTPGMQERLATLRTDLPHLQGL
jgi:hypothetical protein